MTGLPLVLGLLGFAMMWASILFARMAWPRFKNLERRGVLKKPVPDIEPTGNTNSARTFGLIWLTAIPADRPQLKRLILACRACQILGVLLMLSGMILMSSTTNAPVSTPAGVRSPPPITLTVPDQDH